MADLLTWFYEATIAVLVVTTSIRAAYRRDPESLDVALMFLTLGAFVWVEWFQPLLGTELATLTKVGLLAVAIHPYVMVRLVDRLRPIPRFGHLLAAGGVAFSFALVLSVPALEGVVLVTAAVPFVSIEAAVAAVLVRGALVHQGVLRRRLALAATGTALFAVAVALVALEAPLGVPAGTLQPAFPALVAVAFAAYYLAFATPRWLVETWQLKRVYRFQRRMGEIVLQTQGDALEELCHEAADLLGARTGFALLETGSGDQAELELTAAWPSPPGQLSLGDRLPRVHVEGTRILTEASQLGDTGRRLLAATSAEGLVVTPLAGHERAWGVLVVPIERVTLFLRDSTGAVERMAELVGLHLSQERAIEQRERRANEAAELRAELEALGQMTTLASHSFKEPLRNIAGYAQLLERRYGDRDEDADTYAGFVVDAVERMRQLLDDFVTYADTVASSADPRRIEPETLAREVLASFEDRVHRTEAEVEVGQIPPAVADPDHLTIVLRQLADNALAFGGPGVRVRVHGEQVDGFTHVYVDDDGPGIAPEHRDRALQIFQQLDPPEHREGTGLGLALAAKLAERGGGSLQLETSPPGGLRVHLRLPSPPAAS